MAAPRPCPRLLTPAALQKLKIGHADRHPTKQGTIETTSHERIPGREQQLSQQSPAESNPWEILAIASLLLLPGLGLLLQKHELILVASERRISRTSLTVFSPARRMCSEHW